VVGEVGYVAMNGLSTHLARYDPALGRVPTRVAQALFSGEDWVTTADLAITTALDAAAPNTRRAWRNDWAVFRAWALGRAAQWFPAEGERVRLPLLPELVVRFIQDLTAGEGGEPPRSIATVRRYLSTLSTLHRLLDVPDPTKAAVVRNTLKARARRSGGQVQAAPLRWAQVEAVIEVLSDDLAGLRDKTVLAVAHNTLARRAELVALDVSDVEFLDDGVATVALRPTKTDLEAEQDFRFLSPRTAALVRDWLARSGLREGPLFPRMQCNGAACVSNGQRGAGRAVLSHGQRLSAAQVNVIVKLAIARLATAQGELAVGQWGPAQRRQAMLAYAKDYSGHSLRVGAAQDMAAVGIGTAAILQAGGWKDERMVRRYIRKLGALEGGMAQFFGRVAG
jgi:integrase/recombinase XerD